VRVDDGGSDEVAELGAAANVMIERLADEERADEQLGCLAEIFTGQLGGMPWEILGSTFDVAGVVRAAVEIEGEGLKTTMRAEGVGEATGTTLKNPVTGAEHGVSIVLDEGFIWKTGECGQGSFDVEAEGIHLAFQDSNWILYDFEWSNDGA